MEHRPQTGEPDARVRALVTDARQTIEKAENPTDVKAALSSLVDTLAYSEELRRGFLSSSFYSTFATFLLRHVGPNWLISFTSKERDRWFCTFFRPGECATAIDSFTLLVSHLDSLNPAKSPTDRFMFEAILNMLHTWISKHGFASLLIEQFELEATVAADWNTLRSLICSLPDRIQNKLAGEALPPILAGYFEDVVTQSLQVVNKFTLESSRTSALLSNIGHLWAKLSVLSQADILGRHIIRHCLSSPTAVPCIAAIFQPLPSHSLEPLLIAMLRYATSDTAALGVLKRIVAIELRTALTDSTSPLHYLLCNKFLIVRTFVENIGHCIVELIAAVDAPDSLLRRTLIRVAEVWADRTFVKQSSLEQQRYITRILLYGLARCTKQQLEGDLLSHLMNGVQVHFESPVQRIRVMGMRVAERFSVLLDPERPLKFDIESDAADDFNESPPTEPSSSATTTVTPHTESYEKLDERAAPSENKSKEKTRKQKTKKGKEKAIRAEDEDEEENPDELVLMNNDDDRHRASQYGDCASDSDESEHKSDSSDSESDLPAYNLHDDESDLSPVKVPAQLRDCLIGLRATVGQGVSESDVVDRIEGALRGIERLVRLRLDGLDEISESLAGALLHLRDDYGIKDFAELQRKALIALAATSPEGAAGYLATQFGARNYTVMHRVLMVEVLTEAAAEMSGLSDKKHKDSQPTDKTAPPMDGMLLKPVSTRQVTASAPDVPTPAGPREMQTRRWGYAKHPNATLKPAAKPNRFAAVVAPYFFWPLAHNFDRLLDSSLSRSSAAEEDAMLLGKLVGALAVFVECAGVAASVDTVISLTRALMEMVLNVRFHPQPVVRRAALFAASRVVAAVPFDSVLMSEFLTEISELRDWAAALASEDPDDECRMLARAFLACFAASVQGSEILRKRLSTPTLNAMRKTTFTFGKYQIALDHIVPETNEEAAELTAGGIDATGIMVWPASEITCDFIVTHEEVFRGKSLIELGTGTGLCGLIAAQICDRVVLTDGNSIVMDMLAQNINQNAKHFAKQPEYRQLLWGKHASHASELHGKFDIVLASDVVYDKKYVSALFEEAMALLAPDPADLASLPQVAESASDNAIEISVNKLQANVNRPMIILMTPRRAEAVEFAIEEARHQHQLECVYQHMYDIPEREAYHFAKHTLLSIFVRRCRS